MHDPRSTTPAPRYIPYKQEGWGIAFLVVLLAVGCALGAYYVHERTHRPPTDVRAQAAGGGAAAHE